jgi:hypothetical protein
MTLMGAELSREPNKVDQWGIEPQSPVCDTGVFPLTL